MDQQLSYELNRQANRELKSSYLFFAMSTHFDEIMMEGFAKYMKHKASECLNQAQRIYDYLILRDEKLSFFHVDEIDTSWSDTTDIFSCALSFEESMLEETKRLYSFARDVDDIAAMEFISHLIKAKTKSSSGFRKLVFRIRNSNLVTAGVEHLNNVMDRVI